MDRFFASRRPLSYQFPVVPFLIFLLPLLCFFFVSPSVLAGQEKGPAFSDPEDGFAMPDEWVARTVSHAAGQGNADLVVTLDQHLYPALKPLIEQFAFERKLTIWVSEGTCGISAGKLVAKQVDIGGFCCPPEKIDRLPGLSYHTIGIAAVALYVHPSNPLRSISLAEARRVFSGEILRWQQLKTADGGPGPDLPILPVVRLHCPKRPGHWRLLLDQVEMFSQDAVEVAAIPDMLEVVAGNRSAIGFETLFSAEKHGRRKDVRPLLLDGVDPASREDLLLLRYPLYRTYTVATWQADATAAALVSYVLARIDSLDPKFGIVPAEDLRRAGWKFKGTELIGEPR